MRYVHARRAKNACLFAILAVAGAGCVWGAAPTARPMVEIHSGDRLLEATLLRQSGDRLELLGRDGRLWDLDQGAIKSWRKLPMSFRGASATDVRAGLERELDGQLSVGGSGHFVVAAPRGQVSLWSQRFEDLYRSFVHYFAVRGLAPRDPEFPLIAIVWPSQAEFLRHANEDGHKIGPSVLGFYSPWTNRVSLYDSAQLRSGDWGQNAAVIIHEATHQTAFNTGLHNRLALPPRWLAEGLGMLFEAPGVWNSERFTQQSQRVNRERLTSFRRCLAEGRKPLTWLELVGSDAMFSRRPVEAYAESWAFTYFLAETAPAKYNSLLKRTAAKPDFSLYPAAARVADFKAIFGDNFTMLEADFLRYIAAIR
jgi:hypothetical protein